MDHIVIPKLSTSNKKLVWEALIFLLFRYPFVKKTNVENEWARHLSNDSISSVLFTVYCLYNGEIFQKKRNLRAIIYI